MSNQLTKNFTKQEMVVSKQFPELASRIKPTEEQYARLLLLLQSTVQPLRDKFGSIRILSGIRNEELNAKVGGAKNSDHKYATALDLDFLNGNVEEAFKYILESQELPYRQLIYYPAQEFIHISGNIPGLDYKHEAYVKVGNKYEVPKKGLNYV